MNQKRSSELARTGFEQFEAGKYSEAEASYREALVLADPNHWAVEDYHGEFSLVLRALGKTDEALEQLKLSLAAALNAASDNTDLNVTIARHFLAEYLVELGQYDQAILSVRPYLGTGCEKEWLLSIPLVRSYLRMGHPDLARQAMEEALEKMPNEESADIRQRFQNTVAGENS